MLEKLSWILPITILISSLVDTILVVIYMKFLHPWRDILSSELKSEMTNEPTPRLESLSENPSFKPFHILSTTEISGAHIESNV